MNGEISAHNNPSDRHNTHNNPLPPARPDLAYLVPDRAADTLAPFRKRVARAVRVCPLGLALDLVHFVVHHIHTHRIGLQHLPGL